MPSDFYIVPTASLDATADAIRAKTGTQAAIEYTQDGFADAIDAIPSGGGTAVLDEVLDGTVVNFVSNAVTILSGRVCEGRTNIITVSLPECTEFKGGYFFKGCTNLTTFSAPKLSIISTSEICSNCTSLTVIVLPSFTRFSNNNNFAGCTSLAAVDLSNSGLTYANNAFSQREFLNDSSLTTLVLRSSAIMKLGNLNNFDGTPFASGGSGGTIYIPKSLYDHLGDGTSNDYKAATNWSTIEGYGTIIWAKIEGSYYETHYADGTLIPTT